MSEQESRLRLKYSASKLNRLSALDFSTFSETIPLPLHIYKLSSILGAAPRSPGACPSRRPASGVRGLGRRPKTVASLKAWSLGAWPQKAASRWLCCKCTAYWIFKVQNLGRAARRPRVQGARHLETDLARQQEVPNPGGWVGLKITHWHC